MARENKVSIEEDVILEWCPYCEEESRIEDKMVMQVCEHCGSKIKPCTLCEECMECPIRELEK